MNKSINDLQPHPLNVEIYGTETDEGLVQSIRENGILHPLLIDHSNRVISGHRRLAAARTAGLQEIPVTVFPLEDELAIEAALLEANRQRIKSNEQLAREAAHLLRIEKTRAAERQAKANAKEEVPAKSPEDNGDARDLAAKKLGIGGKKLQQAAVVIETIDRLQAVGDREGAEKVRDELNRRSVNRAFTVARDNGYLEGAGGDPKNQPEEHILISQWNQLSDEQRQQELAKDYAPGQFTLQEAEGMEWARFSWNPITGCDRGCEYCSARDVANRIYRQGFQPAFYPGRLKAPSASKLPKQASAHVGSRNVLVCSMADLFGPWVPDDLIRLVLDAVRSAPQWNFVFLTKDPERLCSFEFSDNCWVGTSVDSQARVEMAEQAFEKIKAPVKWVACEPLLERITFSRLNLFNWLVLGGASKSSKTAESRPPREWVEHLWHQADAAKIKVYEKPNLLERRCEFPGSSDPQGK